MSDTVEVDEENLETVLEYVDGLAADAACPPEVAEAALLLGEEVDEQ